MAFDYSTIFAGSEAGDVWLADSGDHFQESGRTTPAGDGDPVGSATGQAGNFNANQSSASLRPTLRQDAGGKWYFDHADDYLVAGTTSDWIFLHYTATLATYACAAVRFGVTADPNALYGLFGTSSASGSSRGYTVFYDNRTIVPSVQSCRASLYSGGAVVFYGPPDATPAQTDVVIESIRDGAFYTVWVNGEIIIAGLEWQNDSGSVSSNALAIGALGGGGGPLTGNLYGLLVTDTIPSDADRAAIRLDMSDRCINPVWNTASVTLPGFPASESGINVTCRVDDESAPFYYVTGQSANGSGELSIAATGCPLATGTRTILITCDNTDGTAGGVSNNHRAFHDYVEVTVS